MVATCFYFQVHQPYRLKKYSFFDIGEKRDYFSDQSQERTNNKKILQKVATKCYLPANKTIKHMIEENPEFKASYSFSGVFLDQCEEYAPEVLSSFQELTDTGNVEVLDETHYHSLSFLYSKPEFKHQVLQHRAAIKKHFGKHPTVFRNTELIYNNELAKTIEDMGYSGIVAEGHDPLLGWRSPNFLYRPKTTTDLKVLLKNYRLSDDIAFRFSNRSWSEWPLTAPKFANWANEINGNGHLLNLFMDYETFGEHQWEDTGIFEFLRSLPRELLKHPDNTFMTPSEAIARHPVMDELDVHHFISWADMERDLSAWVGNDMQNAALSALYALEEPVRQTRDDSLLEDWRKLTTSDHFYYMCTKWFEDGDVHKYFNPYESPYEAFISFMNVLHDLRVRIDAKKTQIYNVAEAQY